MNYSSDIILSCDLQEDFMNDWIHFHPALSIFVSNSLQEFVNYTDILPAISTDHSPVLISLSSDNSDNNGRGPWKYNSSLVYDECYIENMKKLITKINTWTRRCSDELGIFEIWNSKIYELLLKNRC